MMNIFCYIVTFLKSKRLTCTLNIVFITARKRSLGKGNVFRGVCLSTEGLCMMSLPVWLPGPMLLLGVSVPGVMFLLGGLCSGGPSPEGGLSEGDLCPGGGVSVGRPGIRKAGSMHPTGMLSCYSSFKTYKTEK